MPTWKQWGLLLFLGAGVNGLGYLFWILALKKGDTARISTAVYATPFVALIYLALFGKGRLQLFHLASLALIVAGPLVQRIGRSMAAGSGRTMNQGRFARKPQHSSRDAVGTGGSDGRP